MKKTILTTVLCTMPILANAAIPYRTQQVSMPVADTEVRISEHRFYVGGAYNFSMWQNFTDNTNVSINGKNSSGYEVFIGSRVDDTFRIEANYLHTDAKWNQFSITGDTFFLNAIFDARIDSMYRLFKTQMLVPYVGVGAGATWNSANDGISLGNKISPAVAALAGISVEFNPVFALDFGYRYMHMFSPDVNVITDLNPSAHQFRAGARISF